MENYKKCKYCKFAKVNDDWLDSTEPYPQDDICYIICDKTKEIVSDDFNCKDFILDKRVYRESNC